ncbi:MAG: hypothetical protein ABIJ45_02840 [Candidatus Zixiibacteriota bacterium]
MNSPDLLSVCGSSFFAVFVLLTILAILMRIITGLFPEKETGTDPAIIAVISVATSSTYPGTKITKIEEI